MSLRISLLFCLCLLCSTSVLAELPTQVELDFAVLSGTIVMPLNDEYLVDLDAGDHLAVGDILTLVKAGEKIFHPVTGEVLGSIHIPLGYLKVTRLHSGYSYARPITPALAPKNGDQVRRFEQVPARFTDEAGDDGGLAGQIRMDLPQFRWLPEGSSEEPLVTFQLKSSALVVKTVDDNVLHSYKVQEDRQLAPPPAPVVQAYGTQQPRSERKLLEQVADSVMTTLKLKDDNQLTPGDVGVIRQKSTGLRGVWIGPNLGGNPVGLGVGDLDGDGRLETAVAYDSRLLITRIEQGQFSEVAEIDIPGRKQLLSLDVADLNHNGRPELYLTAIDGYQLSSLVIEYHEDRFEILVDNLAWYLRVAELPGLGQTLIGQDLANDMQSFSGDPFVLQLDGNRLVKGESIKLPGLVNLYSFMPFTDAQGQLLYAYVTSGDYLAVASAAGKELWVSAEYFGGSETCFDNRKGNDADMVIPTCLRPRLLMTPDNEILVVQNDGQRLMQRYRKFKESRVIALTWNGFALDESWRTASQRGYLGDFNLADADNDGSAELVMAVKFQHKGLIDDARSAIVIYELN